VYAVSTQCRDLRVATYRRANRCGVAFEKSPNFAAVREGVGRTAFVLWVACNSMLRFGNWKYSEAQRCASRRSAMRARASIRCSLRCWLRCQLRARPACLRRSRQSQCFPCDSALPSHWTTAYSLSALRLARCYSRSQPQGARSHQRGTYQCRQTTMTSSGNAGV
jgi:hypothetical protein